MVGSVYKRTAEEIVAQDIAPFKDFSWDKSFTYTVDNRSHTVTVRSPGTPPRTAKFNGDQGCAILPRGETEIHFKPVAVPRKLPDRGDAGLADRRHRRDRAAAGRRGHGRRERRARLGHGADAAQHPRDRGDL